jgi:hypothetical protein
MIKVNQQNQIEVYNIVPVYRNNRIIKFLTSVSISDILKVEGIVRYDVQTQRGQRVRDNKLENIMSKKNIEEMKIKILDDFFDGGMLCWNVRLSQIEKEKDVIKFIPEENKIVILSPDITLPDSYQRHSAIWGLKNYNFSINQQNYNFPLSICMYTLAEEQNLFSEINGCGSKACKTRTLYLNNAHKNILVKDIIKRSALKDNVEVVQDSVYRKDKVVAFATLYSSWFDKRVGAFRVLQEEQSDEFRDWIIRFYNELVEIRPELKYMTAEERYNISKSSIAFSTHVWFAYANVAKLLQDDTNWKRRLQRLNKPYKSGQWEGDIFSLENPIWHGTISVQNKKGEWKLVNNRTSQQFCTDIVTRFLNLG